MIRSARSHTGTKCLSLLAGALIVFHIWILWERIRDLSLFQTSVALHWALAGAVFTLGLWLRRRGVSLFWGKRAIVFWMLVLLLHFVGTTPLPESVAGGLNIAREATFFWLIPGSAAALLGYATARPLHRPCSLGLIAPTEYSFAIRYSMTAPLRDEFHAYQRFSRPPPFCYYSR